jgi:hypothetical protein
MKNLAKREHSASGSPNLFGNLRTGTPVTVGRLTCYPLFGPSMDPFYLTLREALRQGFVAVSEVSAEGRVPEITVENRGPMPVLLLDGQELVGAKQNRILNISILVPAGTQLNVPVSCVEAGRWASRSRHFDAAPHSHFASSRAKAVRSVTAALQQCGKAQTNQGEIWADIELKSAHLQANSPSRAADAVFVAAARTLTDVRNHLPCLAGQVGGVFAVDGSVIGLEFVDSTAICHEVWPAILASFGVEAADPSYKAPGAYRSPADLMRALETCEVSTFPGIGLGENLRLRDAAFDAGALVYDQRALHLNAFTRDHGI